jgi:hypothetical protein
VIAVKKFKEQSNSWIRLIQKLRIFQNYDDIIIILKMNPIFNDNILAVGLTEFP